MSDDQNKPQDSIEATDELTEKELEQVAGGVEHSEIVVTKLLDATSPRLITDGTSNTIMTAK